MNQDNQSTIKLSKNGKSSSGKGIHHVNIQYFFITNLIARKEVAIEYCPTKQMVADYFTKPLQGELFYTGVCWMTSPVILAPRGNPIKFPRK
jgi:hypothetical protein